MNKKYPLVASDAFLSQNIDTLNKYSAVEEFADALGDGNDKNLRGIEYHLIQLRNDLRKRLVAKQIFIGTSIIEEVIFNCARNGASDSVNAAFKLINSSVVASPGLIIYPLNSFGILGVAGCVLRGEEFPTFVLPDCGIALIPQQNSIEKVKRRISEMVSELGVRAKLDERLFEHYHVSRDLKWLENNPLLFVKVRQFQDYFHENQFFVVRKTLFARLLVYMLHVLQDDPDTDVEPLWSTSRVNNWETLDCKHYLLLQRDPRSASKLSVNCVPMNIDRAELTEMCELNANINRQAWQRKEKRFNQVVLAVKQFEKIYFGNIFRTNKNNQWRRLLERLERSIRYFTRSFRNSSLNFDSNVYLAMAFEGLLDDFYQPGLAARILRRARIALKGVRGVNAYVAAIQKVIESRGSIVHLGDSSIRIDITNARKAYVLIFVQIVSLLTSVASVNKERPIGVLLGD